MPVVIIDGVEYIPKCEVPELTDKRLKGCLEVLTEMRYFNEQHKMKRLAWNAINELAPELSQMSEYEAFNRMHGKLD